MPAESHRPPRISVLLLPLNRAHLRVPRIPHLCHLPSVTARLVLQFRIVLENAARRVGLAAHEAINSFSKQKEKTEALPRETREIRTQKISAIFSQLQLLQYIVLGIDC